ncbi:hypothetical protein V5799_009107 [Amblyomma americanum]|uniref:Uncharacterized protein n=1 Tax=Amblyomma americanum TaxID=6943 RepID=A0AAQ4FCI2_AMBAM
MQAAVIQQSKGMQTHGNTRSQAVQTDFLQFQEVASPVFPESGTHFPGMVSIMDMATAATVGHMPHLMQEILAI